eukprot:TRINITY_DN5398_c0_g1_i1.p1 TRINITY_DN5398_c0_g1~~TRINITY_DN5398_c0_g1_i1.p1  ORF type:complete len:362 (-),score=58.78 TRINITY_DN5398_c0_g1_i1:189-1274(-)
MPPVAFCDRVKQSASSISASPEFVKVNPEAIQRTIDAFSTDSEKRASLFRTPPPLALPLKFEDISSEINFIALKRLVTVGGAYRKDVRSACKRTFEDSLFFGCIGLHISSPKVSASVLSGLSLHGVGELFQIPVSREEPVNSSLPGVTVMKPSALRPLVEIIRTILNRTGDRLTELGFVDFASFVLKTLEGCSSADGLVKALVETFPFAFDDEVAVTCDAEDTHPVYMYSRAQALCYDLFKQFHGRDDRFALADVNESLTVCAGALLPERVLTMGWIEFVKDVEPPTLDNPVTQGSRIEVEIRLASVSACELFLHKCRSNDDVHDDMKACTPFALDTYLHTPSSAEGGCDLDLCARDTLFY